MLLQTIRNTFVGNRRRPQKRSLEGEEGIISYQPTSEMAGLRSHREDSG